jgi:hypothetical protein
MSDEHSGGGLHYLGEQLQRLTIGNAGRRKETGEIEAIPGAEGFIFFGPYLPAAPGPYSVRMIFAAASLPPAAEGDSGVIFDATWNIKAVAALALDETSFESGVVAFQFEVPAEPKAAEGLELRVHSQGQYPLVVTSIDLRRVTTAIPPSAARDLR